MSITAYLPLLAQGLAVTVGAWVCSAVLSFVVGMILGIASCAQISSPAVRRAIAVYVFVARGVPVYVQILLAYFVLPALFGISLPAMFAATLALGFCSAGYVTEIVRSGINALPVGQWDASVMLGFSKRQALRYVVLPQVLYTVTPILLGELESLLKSTSLFASIGIVELTRAGMNIISRELNPVPVYLLVAGIYLLLSACMALLVRLLKKRYALFL